ncbi:unnamed protein product, partial [Hapterophycus canaliculatus]
MKLSGFLSASLAILGSAFVSASSRLDVIDLPNGFYPEGITNGEGWTAYVGSLQTGNIWKGDLETGEGQVMELSAPGPAVGLDYDRRSGYLFVAGGPVGTARVYDEHFGLVADLALAEEGDSTFVNDVIITKTAAFFTDSFQRKMYKVDLDRHSGALVGGEGGVHTIMLSENVPVVEGAFNTNGVEAVDDGSKLIVVNSFSQQLYTIDPDTGVAVLVDLGGELLPGAGGDGLVLRKNTLWIVDNSIEQVIEVSLSADLTCGSVA